MSVFLILIPISLGLAAGFVVLCLASIRNGQFDDLESPRWRILFEAPPANTEAPPIDTRNIARKNHETHPV